MKMTSAMAAKELKKLNEQHEALLAKERKSAEFVAAIQENIETVRPEYDYAAVQKALADTEQRIRALKHAVNRFNLTQTVPGFEMTIDQMLIYIPQLSARKRKLEQMRDKLPRERAASYGSAGIIEYTYANYDVKAAAADCDAVTDELSRAQNALDLVNSTVEFEV
ncbi:MAG: hypothetical protein IJ174_06255 [Clostridia bacterium]|nr:hypothetical protein [Clostridia bacterium]